MFGYVTAYKPELRLKEFELYKSVYCSVCRDLGKKYGLISRFSLSYDFTFLTLLYISLRDGCLATSRKRCVCNPLKKCNFVENSEIPDFPLAAAEIMLYYKILDNIDDEGFLKGMAYRVLKLFSKKGFKRAKNEFPILNEIFSEYFRSQKKLEAENTANIDKAADPTAKMLSRLFAMCAVDNESRALERLGYCMGRWIYLLDAAADLKEDISKNRYNPLRIEFLNNSYNQDINSFLRDKLLSSLNICVNESIAAFELIDIQRFKNILGNIIYLGLEDSQNRIFKELEK